jgi:hypothetical protein
MAKLYSEWREDLELNTNLKGATRLISTILSGRKIASAHHSLLLLPLLLPLNPVLSTYVGFNIF